MLVEKSWSGNISPVCKGIVARDSGVFDTSWILAVGVQVLSFSNNLLWYD